MEYNHNNSGHWFSCADCEEKKDFSPHNFSSFSCDVCGYSLTPTARIVYQFPPNGEYAKVVEYNGANTEIVIP